MTTGRMNIKEGDTVLVLSGKEKGKKGKVISCDPAVGRVIVEGINIVKRHTRPTQKSPQGGIKDQEAPLYGSKVMLVCPSCKKPSRAGKKILTDGKKVRVCKKCGEAIDR
ncbi:MAG: 50S ribosomal protein L24 [Candidatus Syntrophonatronum acetioxidans]|uniref:Large ribosomal subunit protein uL24 n=1 Tax=Candidatus Syntrophonatronum acetioxidans TaxID=1795816 RepID=A0A424YH64_9FIRM|nr:MAG: 50S ribosomal protein L24 [Candidatus Syntrophonatronum acetioxidans]